MSRLLRFVLASVLVLSAVVVPAAAPPVVRLTILHTNDTHGHLLPFSYPQDATAEPGMAGLRERGNIGGIARRAALVQRIRKEMSSSGGTVWLVDAGDFSDGTPFSTEYQGEADVAAMNAAGYTLATLGNHEFNYPLAHTKKLIALAKYPIVCANAVETATGGPLAQAFRIEKVGGVRIGVFGLMTRETATYPAAKEGVTILDEIETARKIVATLRSKADIVVLISHCGEHDGQSARHRGARHRRHRRRALALAPAVGRVRVAFGGPEGRRGERHRHRAGPPVGRRAGPAGPAACPRRAPARGMWIGTARASSRSPAPCPTDAAVAEVVDRFWKPLVPRYGDVVGTAAGDFISRGDDGPSTT